MLVFLMLGVLWAQDMQLALVATGLRARPDYRRVAAPSGR